ncbi:MAG TPA: VCBS repeat-containing protein, partial [Hanamia sp.]|nr:VCBS repeat-containing protein [Hanamia sp.]
MKNKNLLYLFVYCVCFIVSGCKEKNKNQLFSFLSSKQSGIDFSNNIDETKLKGGALNEFGYMGGGVGILDINNDGLKDIFFCGNQVSSRLYLNKGDNQFEDITQSAGVFTTDWISGISVVDINNDGYDDIYLCTYGDSSGRRSHNLLFINQHNNTFKEEATSYGLADTSYSTQVVFFDYDKDGDLDMYLCNYMLNVSYSANYLFPKNLSGNSPANDRLYRNGGNKNGLKHPVFTDVSKEAGIKEDGYGLGVSVADFNMDGWPDIYVSNDFVSNDDFWLNNKNGTFTNVLDRSTKHQSYSSMGIDAADINNDGNIDFGTVDMMPEDNFRKKQIYSFMNYDRYQQERGMGYSPEFSRNMLQLNNGNYYSGDTSFPFFSDIGQLAGICETDWSWSILFADFNNDGLKDLHITNGIGRDFINADFIDFSKTAQNAASEEERQKMLNDKIVSLGHVA